MADYAALKKGGFMRQRQIVKDFFIKFTKNPQKKVPEAPYGF